MYYQVIIYFNRDNLIEYFKTKDEAIALCNKFKAYQSSIVKFKKDKPVALVYQEMKNNHAIAF